MGILRISTSQRRCECELVNIPKCWHLIISSLLASIPLHIGQYPCCGSFYCQLHSPSSIRPFPVGLTPSVGHTLPTVSQVQLWLTQDCHIHIDSHSHHSKSHALLSYKGLSGSPETRTTSSSAWHHETGAPPPLGGHAPILPLRCSTFPPPGHLLVLKLTSVVPLPECSPPPKATLQPKGFK